ncbi:tyrosine-type recombinase/integrase [Luteimonas sp. RD2P54]|uniref:Tyrosine-type recombinase/integrase n=1 Tax=Luteimonas endophytica TaxID=3042023 RepID=A0ABT6JBI5_9GAMM|nr:tyrosine-type recombinase/integrase [Luteimonas endophytica]MDH5824192.1 tyrosine-type recombinase/integrase [Luteimonas endophytica]
MEGKQSRRVALTATMVKEQLSIARIPVIGATGKIVKFAPNAEQKRYVVFDAHRDAPVGFGVAVNRTSMSYILQRRVGARVMKATIGNCRDIPLAKAREDAKAALEAMRNTGRTPAEAREVSKGEIHVASMTVAECIALYRKHLVERAQPAKDSSLRGLEQALRRLGRPGVDLANQKVGDLVTEKRILEAFDTLARGKRALVTGTKRANPDTKAYERPTITTAELTFRWASRAVDYCMTRERRIAANAGRAPSLQTNPFQVLRDEGRYRTKKQLEEHYEATGARNPLQLRDGSLGRFLEALWEKRKVPNHRTACDYLFLTLLWGTRRGEAAPLRWRHRITKEEASVCSWVDLEAGWVSFFDTKNGTTHTLPLAPAARRILVLREEASQEAASPWVFPARSSKATQGHYLDSKAILEGLKKNGGIQELRTHDLRRTFATVAEEMTSYAVVKRLLNHRDLRDVTGRYSRVDEDRLLEELTRVESAMLRSAPYVAVAALPV